MIHFGKKSVFLLEPERPLLDREREGEPERAGRVLRRSARADRLPDPAGRRGSEQGASRRAPPGAGPPACGQARRGPVRRASHVPGLGFAHAEWSSIARSWDPTPRSPAPTTGACRATRPAAASARRPSACRGPSAARVFAPAISRPARSPTSATYGIELGQGCQDNRISRCKLTDLGAGGVKIGETAIRSNAERAGLQERGLRLRHRRRRQPVPELRGPLDRPVARQHASPTTTSTTSSTPAISIGWTWGYGPAAAQRNIIEANHIHHLGTRPTARPILSDMGGIYTLGNHAGTVIRGNLFHDVAGLKYGGWGIYFDEGTTAHPGREQPGLPHDARRLPPALRQGEHRPQQHLRPGPRCADPAHPRRGPPELPLRAQHRLLGEGPALRGRLEQAECGVRRQHLLEGGRPRHPVRQPDLGRVAEGRAWTSTRRSPIPIWPTRPAAISSSAPRRRMPWRVSCRSTCPASGRGEPVRSSFRPSGFRAIHTGSCGDLADRGK